MVKSKKIKLNNCPIPGEHWVDFEGNKYEIITMCVNTEDGEHMVVYQSFSYGTIYTTPYSLWDETVSNRRGSLGPRFAKMKKR